jgi:hypothetical protein
VSGPEAIKLVKNFVYRHELYHILDRKEGSKDPKEIDVAELLAEFYGELAQNGEQKHAKYNRALRDYNAQYARAYREGRISQDSSKLEALVAEYISKAEKLGLKGEDVEDYIASKLEQEVGKLEESGDSETKESSAKESKYSKHAATGDDDSDSDSEEGDSGGD